MPRAEDPPAGDVEPQSGGEHLLQVLQVAKDVHPEDVAVRNGLQVCRFKLILMFANKIVRIESTFVVLRRRGVPVLQPLVLVVEGPNVVPEGVRAAVPGLF